MTFRWYLGHPKKVLQALPYLLQQLPRSLHGVSLSQKKNDPAALELAERFVAHAKNAGIMPPAWKLFGTIPNRSGEIIARVGDTADRGAMKISKPGGKDVIAATQTVATIAESCEAIRPYLPSFLGTGKEEGREYSLYRWIRGSSLDQLQAQGLARTHHLVEGITALDALHRSTGALVAIDQAQVDQWYGPVFDGLEELWTAKGKSSREIEEVRQGFSQLLIGQELWVSRVHGDFFPGNMLFSEGKLSGIIDWDRSKTHSLALVDLAYLVVNEEMRGSGSPLGQVIVDLLNGEHLRRKAKKLSELDLVANQGCEWDPLLWCSVAWLAHVGDNLGNRERYFHHVLWFHENVRTVVKVLADELAARR